MTDAIITVLHWFNIRVLLALTIIGVIALIIEWFKIKESLIAIRLSILSLEEGGEVEE